MKKLADRMRHLRTVRRPSRSLEFPVLLMVSGVGWAAFAEALRVSMRGSTALRNQADDTVIRKIPGLTKYKALVLKRGIIGNATLWRWIHAAGSRLPPRTATIKLFDEKRGTVATWKMKKAWPVKWAGPPLGATKNEVAMESLELCHEGIVVE